MAFAFLLIYLLVISGVFGQNWNVIYKSKSMCVLKGSSVNMSCTYRYPQGHTLTDTFWLKVPNVNMESLKDYPEYKDRVEYFDDRLNKTAVLRLNNVTENDKKEYRFRMITDMNRWSGQPGIKLHVSGLQVQAPPLVLEKQTLNLTCRSSCNLSDRFIWYKNGQALNFTSDTLQFQAVRSDSGRYSCAVRGHEHLPSPAVSISVEYPPQSISVLINGSGVIVEGDSVTLKCISDSNPPALNFSWFKENETSAVGSGQSFSISSFNSSFSGRFYCEAQNKYGSGRSASVSLTVNGVQKSGWNNMHIIAVFAAIAVAVGFGLLFHMVGFNIGFKREEIMTLKSLSSRRQKRPQNLVVVKMRLFKMAEIQTQRNLKRMRFIMPALHFPIVLLKPNLLQARRRICL
ncbi:hypothetical protein F2P79_007849 [Pimephales promelas]|nr:hypothetical protein F2P79_007849 [Pimephales promelas]